MKKNEIEKILSSNCGGALVIRSENDLLLTFPLGYIITNCECGRSGNNNFSTIPALFRELRAEIFDDRGYKCWNIHQGTDLRTLTERNGSWQTLLPYHYTSRNHARVSEYLQRPYLAANGSSASSFENGTTEYSLAHLRIDAAS